MDVYSMLRRRCTNKALFPYVVHTKIGTPEQSWRDVMFNFCPHQNSTAYAQLAYYDIVLHPTDPPLCLGKHRPIATGLVCLVSTGPLFLSLMVCLAFPISVITWRMLTHHSQAHRWHVENCDMATNSAKEVFWVLLPTTFHSSKWTINLTSIICKGCGLQGEWTTRKPKPVLYDAMNRKGTYSYMWNSVSGLWEASHWP